MDEERSGMKMWSLILAVLLVVVCTQAVVCAEVVPISQITEGKLNSIVTISGKITNMIPPWSQKSPYSYYVADDTEVIRVVIWQNIYALIMRPERFKVGTKVQITGEVKKFRGNLEIHLTGPSGMKLASETAAMTMTPAPTVIATTPVSTIAPPAAAKLKIENVNKTLLGKKVTIEGKVAAYRESTYERAPSVVTLADGDNSIAVVFWREVGNKLTSEQKPEVGKWLQITGRVNEHNGVLQIKVYEPSDMKVITKKEGCTTITPTASTAPRSE